MTPDEEVPTRQGRRRPTKSAALPSFRASNKRLARRRASRKLIKAPNFSAPSVLDLQDDRLRGSLRAIPHPSCDNLATTESLKSAKSPANILQNLFFHLQDAGRGSVISKISRLRGRYCPKRSKFQSTQSAYPEHRFIGGAPNFPSPFFRKKPFWRTPQTSRLECAQRHVSVKVYFGRLPKQGSLRWDSLKNSRPFPISSFPQMFGFLTQTLRCVLSLRRGG